MLPAAHSPAAALGHGRQRGGVPQLARALPWPQARAGREQGTQDSADLSLGRATSSWANSSCDMAKGDGDNRKTPALVFCFNRDECWSVAESSRGSTCWPADARGRLNARGRQARLAARASGPSSSRCCAAASASIMPGCCRSIAASSRSCSSSKLLAVVVCTETLAAGINLPARSVVLTSLVKGPLGKEKLIDASTAHQIFGRAGRPQFDDRGFVFALAHEDDVRMLRWKEKYDQIPEDTSDPGLLKAKKELKKKKPIAQRQGRVLDRRRSSSSSRPPRRASSTAKARCPGGCWPICSRSRRRSHRVRNVLRKRLMDEPRIAASEKNLDQMLLTLAEHGFVTLDPTAAAAGRCRASKAASCPSRLRGHPCHADAGSSTSCSSSAASIRCTAPSCSTISGIADRNERIQALESVLEMPRPLLRHVRVPCPDKLPPGPLATDAPRCGADPAAA